MFETNTGIKSLNCTNQVNVGAAKQLQFIIVPRHVLNASFHMSDA
jgi:hypothetical protein